MSNEKLSSENNHPGNSERFESDTQKIVRRHLENKNDTITEEDIRNVRIGMTPPSEERTESNWEELVAENKEDNGAKSIDEPITPWDALKE